MIADAIDWQTLAARLCRCLLRPAQTG